MFSKLLDEVVFYPDEIHTFYGFNVIHIVLIWQYELILTFFNGLKPFFKSKNKIIIIKVKKIAVLEEK